MDAPFAIGHHVIALDKPPFVVAEMSGNHGGDLARAMAIIDAVAAAGAHAIKFQTYRADTLTIDAEGQRFRLDDANSLWGGRTLFDLYEEATTPWEWHEQLFERARSQGLIPFSSPFDTTAIALLEELNCAAYKVASAELVDLPLIAAMAATGKPLIMSTGMASLAEIDAAVRTAKVSGAQAVALLVCTAAYPASPEEANLRSIPVLRDAFGVEVGLSDHTRGLGVAIASVACGATIIEKHVTLSRDDGAVDSAFSLEPAELAQLCQESAVAAKSLGNPWFGPRPSEGETLRLRRSLYVVENVRAGETVTRRNVRSIRPAGGLPPAEFINVLGRVFVRDAATGTPLTWDLL